MKILARPLFVSMAQRRYFLSTFLTAFLLLSYSGLSVQAAPGDLDSTFGTGGIVTTPFTSNNDYGRAVALQSDGKIVSAGSASDGTYDNIALTRYNVNGTLDPTFGTGGKVVTPIGSNSSSVANALAIQPDGKIVAVGYIINGEADIAAVRYNADGSLDANFGSGGKVVTAVKAANDVATAVIIQPDGKILVGGSASDFLYNYNFALVRYNANGSLDTNFGTGGKVTLDFSGRDAAAFAMAIQPDGKIIAAGFADYVDSNNHGARNLALARFNVNGSLDSTFGSGGKAHTPLSSNEDVVQAIALQTDGKIVAVGSSNGEKFGVVRYNANGSLDMSFGMGGIVITTFLNYPAGTIAYGVVMQPNHKIVVAGYVHDPHATDLPKYGNSFALARYNEDGTLDSSFGMGGKIYNPAGNSSIGQGMILQPDGNIVVAGYVINPTTSDFQLTRYLGDAPIDTGAPGSVIISELRLSGTAGANDEFIELYNNSDSGIAVSSADGSNGWSLVASDGTVRYTIPFNTIIPARGHYLIANNSASGYSLSNHPAGNLTTAIADGTYTADIADNTGVVLYRTSNPLNFTPANALDAVGFGATPAPYSEGLPLFPVGIPSSGAHSNFNRRLPSLKGFGSNATTASGEYSFVRKVPNANGIPQDTNNNAADFALVATDAGTYGAQTAQLGAPAPENRSSPVVNNKIAVSLVDPLTSRLSGANFVRNGSGNSGTLAIRRHFTNQTGATVTRLRFRVYDITTLNTPVLSPPQADLRLTDSTDQTVSTTMGMVTVKGTQLEQPPTQALGGGLNTSMTVALPTGGLANGDSLDVQFLLSVVMNGRYRFFFTVEALP